MSQAPFPKSVTLSLFGGQQVKAFSFKRCNFMSLPGILRPSSPIRQEKQRGSGSNAMTCNHLLPRNLHASRLTLKHYLPSQDSIGVPHSPKPPRFLSCLDHCRVSFCALCPAGSPPHAQLSFTHTLQGPPSCAQNKIRDPYKNGCQAPNGSPLAGFSVSSTVLCPFNHKNFPVLAQACCILGWQPCEAGAFPPLDLCVWSFPSYLSIKVIFPEILPGLPVTANKPHAPTEALLTSALSFPSHSLSRTEIGLCCCSLGH